MIRIREFPRSSVRIAARWLLSLIFLISAVQTVHDFHDTAVDLAGKHVPLAGVTLGFAVAAELLGAVSLITGLRYRWGAFILLLFLLPVTVTYHSFWLYEGTRRDAQMVHFLKNLAIMGGLLLLIAGTNEVHGEQQDPDILIRPSPSNLPIRRDS